MKTAFSKSICLLTSLLLALTFTLSCSGGDDDDNGPTGNSEYERWQERLKYIDPDDPTERCGSNGTSEYECDVNGGTWYNPLNYVCRRMDSSCDENGDNCTRIYALLTIALCGNEPYIDHPDSREKCQGGVLYRKCGDNWYNKETQYCDDDDTVKAKEHCGNKYYERDEYTDCQNGVVKEKCGGGWGDEPLWYNPDTEYCAYENNGPKVKPLELCGNEYIEPGYEKCNNGVVQQRCGEAAWYNRITQICDWDTGAVRNKVRCSN